MIFLCRMRRSERKKRLDYLRWQRSGLSKRVFCKGKGIGYHTFLKDCKVFGAESQAGFSRVEMPEPTVTERCIEIHERDGRRIVLPLETPAGIIRLFLKGHARTQ